jgi:hypothetical protein
MKTILPLVLSALACVSCEDVAKETGKVVTPLAESLGRELAKPVQKSTEDYAKKLQEDQRLREQRASEEKARLDALPNGPRRK